jgi:hypothetical protein
VGVLLPQTRAALDVGEKECDRTTSITWAHGTLGTPMSVIAHGRALRWHGQSTGVGDFA